MIMDIIPNDIIKVLLVEDDEVDIENIRRAFHKINLPVELYNVANGIEALDVLYEKNNKKHIKLLPDLIIIDINMPKMNGIEFLKQLRANVALDTAQILILTTSDDLKDKLESVEFNVQGYITKPIKVNELADVCKNIGRII